MMEINARTFLLTNFNIPFQSATFKRFNFRFRCKADSYNDQSRVRSTILSASPINWTEHNRRIIKELQEAGATVPINTDNYV